MNSQIDKIRQAEMEYCKGHLEYFVENYVHIEDKDNTENIIQLFQLWEKQKQALRSIHENRLNIILKARQLGMTWLALAYSSWCLLFNKGYTVIALSRTEDEAKELVRRLGVIYRFMPEFIREEVWQGIQLRITSLSIEIQFPTGEISTFKAFASSSGSGRSFTANILLLDEWAFQQNAREIWLSAYPTINRPTGGKVIGLSTIDRGTLFEELYTTDNNFNKIFLSWNTDPRRSTEWYEQTKKDLGDNIMQEYPATVEEALTISGGSYFPEFKPHTHITTYTRTQNRKYVAFDYGFDMFAALFFDVDSKGHTVIYKEIHESGLIASAAVQRLIEVRGEDTIQDYYAPHDMWNRHSDTGKTTAEIFAEANIRLVRASNSREQGCMNIKEYLADREEVNEHTGEHYKAPLLKIAEGAAPNLVRCLTKIQKDKRHPNEYANEPHELTHIVDGLRTFADGRPAPTPIKKPDPISNFEFEKPKPSSIGRGEKINVI